MYDIWDGVILRNLKGPNEQPFISQADQRSELHLVFSMFIDWFNPFGSKQGGQHTSVGAIYLICHNLPIHLRYKFENVYLAGIIPGPREPRQHHLNHLLRPLIDDLLCCWHPGVTLMKSFLNRGFGAIIRVALIPLVCDLPAARKAAGFAGHGFNIGAFCSFCLQSFNDVVNVDVSTWPRRTYEDHLAIAMQWRDAASSAIRDELYAKFAIRWSELLRLPYWDPTRFTVLDVMHNLFLGDLAHHVRNILGIDADAHPPGKEHIKPHTMEEQQEQLDTAISAVKKGSKTSLMRLRRGYIVSLATANNVAPAVTITKDLRYGDKANNSKSLYVDALIEWVSNSRRFLSGV
jgi:hypothetical protein